MSERASLVIRGGTVVDGSGGDPIEADVAVRGGTIAAVGKGLPRGDCEIDASGKLVTPGFVDVHTHYDAQVTWSNRITPSSWNGVTTLMMGNCGVGFAPCKPDQRDMLIELMEGVEDIPEVVLTEGLPWNWESFEDYLNALDARQYDLDVVAQVPHAAVRTYVMGERALAHEPANAEDRAQMAKIAAAGIEAGALGFSTSRTINHKTLAGEHTPTLKAEAAELIEIGAAVGETKSGWLQVISDFDDQEAEFEMLRRIVRAAGRPMTVTILQRDARPEGWRDLLDRIASANADGLPIFGQVLTRPTGIMLGFEVSQNPFVNRPSWNRIADLPFEEKLAFLRQPDFRKQLISETNPDERLAKRVTNWERIFPLGDPPNYEPAPEDSIAAMAARTGADPAELVYDLLLENDGKTILYRPLSNYSYGDLGTVQEMFSHPNSLVGLGDGGAHVGVLSDASAITYMLTHWTRDRTRGGKMPLPWAIKRLSRDNAAAIGLNDRGLIRTGYKADLNVIDYDRLKLCPPKVAYDLPSGGRRLLQRIEGYDATIVSGTPVQIHGEETGALPGRLVRGAKSVG
ncbi:MAG: amidohydrolase family protein [Rhodospirillaceae bacterium]|nr:amidohydrolase family protein [Rhodospirillaceae bacterium]MDD9918972.1 amidohydrolase family protein [Rhodospirillaceae bacterium]MDD9930046.1 amidohydrolase family protein [Rhodospirillaceae bacterium]